MREALAWFLLLAVFPGASSTFAHDLWIEPASFQSVPNSALEVRLRIGEMFKGEVVQLQSENVEQFSLWEGSAEHPVFARPGDSTRGYVRVSEEGVAVLGYRTKPSSLTLEPEKFETYLAIHGLEKIVELRKERGESEKEGRELYSRCAKALVICGQTAEKGFDRRLGFTLELVPEKNPVRLQADEDLPIRLFYRDRPIAGVLIRALNKADTPPKAKAPHKIAVPPASGAPAGLRVLSRRSDAEGRVSFRLKSPGPWLITAVHMIESQDPSLADWESLWASLTFEAASPRPAEQVSPK